MSECKNKIDLENSAKTNITEGTESSGLMETQTNDSDEAFEMFCETCMREGIQSKAYAFCTSCIAYFCSTCLKHHGKFFRKHTYIVGDDMYSKICSEKCETHSKEIVKFYCDTCGKFVCTICKEDLHTDTCRFKYLPDILNDKEIEKEFELLHSHHRAFKEKMLDCQKSLSTKHEHLSNMCGETKCTIKREKDKTFAKFDNVASQIEDKIQTMKKNDDDYFDKLKETDESLASELDKLSENLRNRTTTTTKRNYKMFIDLKLLTDKVQQAESSFDSLSVGRLEPDLEEQTKKISKDVEAYGTLMRSIEPKARKDETVAKKNASEKNACYLDDICVRADGDTENCSIIDCCMLSEKYLVTCDQNNCSLKVIDAKLNKLVYVKSVDMTPITITKIDNHHIAYAESDEDELSSKIRFLTFTKDQTLRFEKRYIDTYMYCVAIAYIYYDKLMILMTSEDGGKVQILDMDGTVLEEIDTSFDEDDIFKNPQSLSINNEMNKAYVTDWYEDGVIEINLDTLDTRSVVHMWHPEGIAIDDEGCVYVIESGTGKLFYFHPQKNNFEKVELLKDKLIDWKPCGICFCSGEKSCTLVKQRMIQ